MTVRFPSCLPLYDFLHFGRFFSIPLQRPGVLYHLLIFIPISLQLGGSLMNIPLTEY